MLNCSENELPEEMNLRNQQALSTFALEFTYAYVFSSELKTDSQCFDA